MTLYSKAVLVWILIALAETVHGIEMTLGHYVFRFSWKWLLNDFNILQGRLLALGMIILLFAPYIAGRLIGLWA